MELLKLSNEFRKALIDANMTIADFCRIKKIDTAHFMHGLKGRVQLTHGEKIKIKHFIESVKTPGGKQ